TTPSAPKRWLRAIFLRSHPPLLTRRDYRRTQTYGQSFTNGDRIVLECVHKTEEKTSMPSRRDFLKGLVAATVSLQSAPAKRREVFVGKRRVKVVDVHGHFVAPEELEVVKNTNLARFVNQNGPLILGPARLEFMDQQGIDIQVLSHQG